MDHRKTRRCLKPFLFNDIRGLSLLLLGSVTYLLLFAAFGRPDVSTMTPRTRGHFPRKLWQTWKVGPASFDERDSERVRSWFVQNPGFRYEVISDQNALFYLQKTYGSEGFNRPDIVDVYKTLNADIVKADLLRYLIMYAEGGIYADIDVKALRPFEGYIPERFREQDIDMIIGVETDEPDFKDHPILGVKAQSFVQWTFVCKPKLPIMLNLVDKIVTSLSVAAFKQGKSISQLQFNFDEVLSGSGPSAFTDAVLAHMSASSGKTIGWDEFHDLRESKVVGKVLVLPSFAFAAGTGHSSSGKPEEPGALVRHYYGASAWTQKHLRHNHPIYGPVEACNWNPECVKLWDTNTAEFDALSKEEQVTLIDLINAEPGEYPKKEDENHSSDNTQSEEEAKAPSSIDKAVDSILEKLEAEEPSQADHETQEKVLDYGSPEELFLE